MNISEDVNRVGTETEEGSNSKDQLMLKTLWISPGYGAVWKMGEELSKFIPNLDNASVSPTDFLISKKLCDKKDYDVYYFGVHGAMKFLSEYDNNFYEYILKNKIVKIGGHGPWDWIRNENLNDLMNVTEFPQYKKEKYYDKAKFIGATNNRIKEVFEQNGYKNNVMLTPHWVDVNFWKRIDYPKNESTTFLMVGETYMMDGGISLDTSIKGYDLILKEMEQLFKWNISFNINFCIHGKTRDQMLDIYNKSDCLIINSRSESCPLPLIENMACEKVVISSGCGVARDVLSPEFVFEIGDIQSAAKKMEWISSMSSDERKNIGKRNREYIIKNRSIDVLKPDWVKFFEA